MFLLAVVTVLFFGAAWFYRSFMESWVAAYFFAAITLAFSIIVTALTGGM